ncbi:helix-turn-helix domain-containing protein [Corynebacterium propinquum]
MSQPQRRFTDDAEQAQSGAEHSVIEEILREITQSISSGPVDFVLTNQQTGNSMALPPAVIPAFHAALVQTTGDGADKQPVNPSEVSRSVAKRPNTKSVLTTQQAADILNVSRPHVVKLLEMGRIPGHKVGSHRRIYAVDVYEYKFQRDHETEKAAQELATLTEEMGLYD